METGKITTTDEWEILPPTKAVVRVTKPVVDEWELLPPVQEATTFTKDELARKSEQAPVNQDEWEIVPTKKTTPPKEKPPWYDNYLGLVRPLLAGAQAGAAGTTRALLKAADFISDKLGIPKSNAARIVADDLERFSQANKARGVGGIAGDIASGIGQAAVDIPTIMSLGPAGLPVYGGLMGAAEGGLPGAVTGAATGALTHRVLKGIGGLATPARVGAGAAFGAATTPGGLEERVKGATVMGALSATGGKPRRGVVDLRPEKMPEKAPRMIVEGQTAPPPPPGEGVTARIVPEAKSLPRVRDEFDPYAPPAKAAGRMVKAAEPAPAGATVGGDVPSPINPVEKVLTDAQGKPAPGAAGITRAVREELQAQPRPPVWGVVKRAIRNPIYLFEKVPVLKKYIRDVDVDAHDKITGQAVERQAKRAEWEKLIDKPARLRVWNYAVGQQAGGPETLEAMGMKPVTSLTPNETRVYTEIRQNLEQMHGRINEARTLLGLKPIGKIKDYFTFLRKGEEMEKMGHDLINDPDAAFLTEHLNRPTDPSFFKQRGLSKKPLESNLFGIYEHYMGRATKYVEKAPVWANSKLLLENIEYEGPAGKKETYNWSKENPAWSKDIKKYVEFSIGQKAPSALEYHFGEYGRRAASAINRNMAAAVLSANIRSALIQPTSLRNSYIELGRKWLFEGVKRGAFSPGGYKEALRLSRVLRGRVFDVHQAMLTDSERSLSWATAGEIKRKIANIGIAPLKFLDANAAVITWQGAYARATAPRERGGLGLVGKSAVIYADDVVTKTQASGAPHDISPIQRTPEGKLASLFQTFVINEWNYLAENAIGLKNEKMSNTDRFWRISRLAIGTAIVNVVLEDVLKMRSPFPTPERAIVEGIRGGEKAGKVAVNVAREFGEQIPILGGSIRWTTPSRVALPATAQLVYDIGRLGAKGLNAISEHDLSKMSVADLAVLGQAFGVPGTSQALKTLRRRQQGGTWPQAIMGQKMETLGSKSAGLSKADETLLKKYGLEGGKTKDAKKKSQKSVDDLMKKYGIK